MEIGTALHTHAVGWSGAFPHLDSKDTLVTVFGSSTLLDEPGPVRELLAAYPLATIVGCSTAGEIFDTSVNDDSLCVAICRFDGTRLRSVAVPVASVADSRGPAICTTRP